MPWVADNAKDAGLRDIARLRLASVMLDEKAYDDALKALDAEHGAAFDALFLAARGDVLVAQDKKDEARSAYKAALDKAGAADAGAARIDPAASGRAGNGEMKRVLALLAMLSAAPLLAGCGGGSMVSNAIDTINPMNWFGSRSAAPEMAPLPVLTQTIKVNTLWQANMGNSQQAIFSPAIAGDSVYAAAYDGTITRLDAASGKQLWRISAGEHLTGGVGAGAGMVVVGSGKGDVLAFDSSGTALWKTQVSSEVLAAPQVAQGVVVVRSADGRIFGLDAKDGKRKWYYQRSTPDADGALAGRYQHFRGRGLCRLCRRQAGRDRFVQRRGALGGNRRAAARHHRTGAGHRCHRPAGGRRARGLRGRLSGPHRLL